MNVDAEPALPCLITTLTLLTVVAWAEISGVRFALAYLHAKHRGHTPQVWRLVFVTAKKFLSIDASPPLFSLHKMFDFLNQCSPDARGYIDTRQNAGGFFEMHRKPKKSPDDGIETVRALVRT